jgi:nucleoside-diphosphate-sugar epimerase
MTRALIGASGYVGTTLQRQAPFDALYRSTTIGAIAGRDFELAVCAAAPAQKWIANREPAADARNIDALMDHLRSFTCRRFVLISTVDVFREPVGVDEASTVDEHGLHAYGLNRRRLERFCAGHFAQCLIVRLPGLVGPGLRKNAIYDFLNDNNVAAIDSRAVFQFYPMVNLWADLQLALTAGLDLVHLAAEPVSVAEVASEGFGRRFENAVAASPARYDLRSRHAAVFGGQGAYAYSRRESLLAIRAYAQSEPRAAMAEGAA